MVSVKRLHERAARGEPFDLRAVMQQPLIVPTARPVIGLLEDFRARGTTFALAADEFGGIAGVVTLHDAMKVVLGELAEPAGAPGPTVTRREDGSMLIDALIRIEELEEHCPGLPVDAEEERDYRTLGGFILRRLDHIPCTGETLVAGPYRIEIVDLDGNRIDKVLVSLQADQAAVSLKD
jgi:putative hemolysin